MGMQASSRDTILHILHVSIHPFDFNVYDYLSSDIIVVTYVILNTHLLCYSACCIDLTAEAHIEE